MAGNFDGLARMIVQNVGGRDNVAGLTFGNHCLIFDLKDMGRANTAVLESIGKVSGVRKQSGKYIVDVDGPIEEVFAAVCERGEIVGTDPNTGAMSGGPAKKGMPLPVMMVLFFAIGFIIEWSVGFMVPEDASMLIKAVFSAVAGLLIAGIGSWIYVKSKSAPKKEKEAPAKEMTSNKHRSQVVEAPIKGRLVPLSEVKDRAFSSEALGKGVAILPEEGRLYAPCDGVLSTFFETGHAIGITTEDGADVLIHVGLETVSLNGGPFVPKKKQGDTCRKGELLLEFDVDAIRKAGLDPITPIIIADTEDFSEIIPLEAETCKPGEVILTLKA